MDGFEVDVYPEVDDESGKETWKVSLDSGECSCCTGEKQFYVAAFDTEQEAQQTLERMWAVAGEVLLKGQRDEQSTGTR